MKALSWSRYLSLIRSDDFKQKVDALGGYNTTATGGRSGGSQSRWRLMVCYASNEVPE